MITTYREAARRPLPVAAVKAPPEERWNDEVLSEMRRLISEGDRSASGIAEELNGKFAFAKPLSRSAVIGKCYRMEISLPGKSPSTATEPKIKRQAVRKPVAPPMAPTDAGVDLFSLPVGPTPISGPLKPANRNHLVMAAAAYDDYHQAVLEWLDSADSDGNIAAERPSAPAATIPYWTGNDPVSLMDLGDRNCHYVTSRSKKYAMSHYCGDRAPTGRFCDWHARMSHITQS